MNDFSDQFRKIIPRYKHIGYNLNVMRQSACLVINPITVDGYAAFFNCTPVGRASDSMMAPTYSDFQWCCLTDQGSPSVMQYIVSVESSSLLRHSYFT